MTLTTWKTSTLPVTLLKIMLRRFFNVNPYQKTQPIEMMELNKDIWASF
jgi:hypothetical protein